MKRYARWNIFEKLGGVAIVVGLIALAVIQFGRFVEGALFPVTSVAVVLETEDMSSETEALTRLTVEAEKLRPCDWTGIKWFLGELDGRAARVPAEFRSAPQVRQTGHHRWTKLFVGLPENLVIQSSYAIVTHSCHPFWDTKTLFYVSEGSE